MTIKNQLLLVSGLSVNQAKVYDFSDWTVTMEWAQNNSFFHTTCGIGMPFLYFTKDAESIARIEINLGTVTISGETIIVEDARNGADFIIYAPTGSVWNQNGSTFTSNLNGNNYWSMVMVPQGESTSNLLKMNTLNLPMFSSKYICELVL